jgi:hypothetical protein
MKPTDLKHHQLSMSAKYGQVSFQPPSSSHHIPATSLQQSCYGKKPGWLASDKQPGDLEGLDLDGSFLHYKY